MTTRAQPAPASSTDAESAQFHTLESYAWSDDNEFQVGLTAILGPNPETSQRSQVEDLTLHARCFYYERCDDASMRAMSVSLALSHVLTPWQKISSASRLLVLQSVEANSATASLVAVGH